MRPTTCGSCLVIAATHVNVTLGTLAAVKPSAKILGRAGHRHLTATEPITGGLGRMRQGILWQTITEHAAATGLVGDADLSTEASRSAAIVMSLSPGAR